MSDEWEDTSCDLCGARNAALEFCYDCGVDFCEDCAMGLHDAMHEMVIAVRSVER